RINNIPDKKLPLDLSIFIQPDTAVSVTLSCGNNKYTYISDKIAQKALKAPLNEDGIRKQFSRLNETPYFLKEIEIHTENAFLSIGDLNEIRRQSIQAFNEYRLSCSHKEPIFNNVSFIELSDEKKGSEMHKQEDDIVLDQIHYLLSPVINPQNVYSDADHQVICEIGGLLNQVKHRIAYYTLNCSNSYCYEFLKKLGFEHVILSTELNDEQIRKLIEAYETRNGTQIYPYVFIQGKLPLMYLKSDPFKDKLQNCEKYHLTDGQNSYEIRYDNRILELQKEIKKNHDSVKEICSYFISD
ncbi:MAG: DUF3656 domain-containing protein, partial [Erysipelotrichaceae bacterium]|nr:DUF3656 domain-containing protein [Erysipelotrichaceae bacterium]